MEDLIGKAHAYLHNKGCKSIGQQYTAFEIEKMLADFAQQQLKLLGIADVVGRTDFRDRYHFPLNKGEQLCGLFEADSKTSSATKCKCGREKWEHPKAT